MQLRIIGGYATLRMGNWGKMGSTVPTGEEDKDPRGRGTEGSSPIDTEITRILK